MSDKQKDYIEHDIDERLRRKPSVFAFLKKPAVYFTLGVWFLLVTLPMIWMLYSSFKPDKDIVQNSWSLPKSFYLGNYEAAWTRYSVSGYFINSVVVVGTALFATLLISAMAAYGLAKLRIKGSRYIYILFILGMIVPAALTMAPLFEVLRSLHLLNSLIGLSFVYTAVSIPFSILMLYGFFSSLPVEIKEAAVVDGANEWQIFWEVFFPMARPGLVTVGIFNFLGMWNDYLLSLVTLIDPQKSTLQLGIANMVVAMNYKNEWGALFATMVLTMLPVLIAYSLVHKKIVEGMVLGSVKG